MDDTVRKKLIIIISMVMSLLIIIALVLWVFLGQKDTSDDDALSQQILYTDPYTGEVVNSKRTGGASPVPDTNDITFLGAGKLLSYGMSSRQLSKYKGYIYQYSKIREKNKEPKITEITIDFSTYRQKISEASDGSEFTIILNRDENLKYQVVNTYPTTSTIATKIYKGDSQVFNSNTIKVDTDE